MQEQKIPQGYKKTEIGIIPEDWEVKKLVEAIGEQPSNIVAGPFGSNLKVEDYTKKGVPILRLQNIDEYKFIERDIKYISNKKANELIYHSFKSGDLVLAKLGEPIGKTCIVPNKIKFGIVVADVVRIRVNELYSDPKFIMYILNSDNCRKQLNNDTIGSTRPRVNLNKIRLLFLPLPPLSEQQAIARVLSDVDRLIESLDKLIEKKKMIKKGAMQELLTGRKRLPGFTGEWVKKKLGEIAEIKKGDLITEKTAKKGDIPVIGGGIEPTYYHNKSNRGPNTITISASGANAGYVNFHTYPIFASDCSTIEENNSYDVKFLYHFLKLKQNDIIKLQTGGAQPHVYPEQLKNLMIYFPPTLEEQQAIAQILSDMDAEIEMLQKKKAKYEKIKKGLMEQLLTGKIRLKDKINEVLQ